MQIKRWALAGLACALLATGFAQMTSGTTHDEPCGLGLPPGAPGFADAQAKEEAQLREQGFLRVCDANLERYRLSLGSIERSTAGLAFEPVALGKTPFARLTSLGGKPETVGDVKSRLYRGFRLPGGQTLILFEHDLSADGSSMSRDPALETERVNGKPARLVAFQTPSGRAMSILSWLEGRRYYELWLDANVARNPLREELLALAASLPAAVPGCPNEIPPKPAKLGPDGMPVIEDLPKFLTDADMNALMKTPRPCK